VTAHPPTITALLGQALAEIATRPPAQRALIDQNTATLRARLDRAGLAVTPATVAAFAAGVAELEFQAARTSGVRAAAASLLHAAAQLTAPAVCPGCVAALDHALAGAGADPSGGPGSRPGPQGGGAR
jgi:hypothetical protein